MKLYRVTWIHPQEGTCYEWHVTATAAKLAAKDLKEEHPDLDCEFQVVGETVPTSIRYAKELCAWLNQRFSRDNG